MMFAPHHRVGGGGGAQPYISSATDERNAGSLKDLKYVTKACDIAEAKFLPEEAVSVTSSCVVVYSMCIGII